jgi:hypothetical protein
LHSDISGGRYDRVLFSVFLTPKRVGFVRLNPPQTTPDNLAGVKCLKFDFRHYMTSVAETPQMQQGGALAGGTRTSSRRTALKINLGQAPLRYD